MSEHNTASEARRGIVDSVKGKLKEVAGAVTGNDSLTAEGQLDQTQAEERKEANTIQAVADAQTEQARTKEAEVRADATQQRIEANSRAEAAENKIEAQQAAQKQGAEQAAQQSAAAQQTPSRTGCPARGATGESRRTRGTPGCGRRSPRCYGRTSKRRSSGLAGKVESRPSSPGSRKVDQ